MKKAKSTKRTVKKLQSAQPALTLTATQRPQKRLEDKPILFCRFGQVIGYIDMTTSIITESEGYGLEARG